MNGKDNKSCLIIRENYYGLLLDGAALKLTILNLYGKTVYLLTDCPLYNVYRAKKESVLSTISNPVSLSKSTMYKPCQGDIDMGKVSMVKICETKEIYVLS